MALKDIYESMHNKRVLAIDPATHSLAWSVLEIKGNSYNILAWGKIDLSEEKDVMRKIKIIRMTLPEVFHVWKPTDFVIEQTVFINNFLTSRKLSYMVGAACAIGTKYCKVHDVPPMTWKPGIGYKNVSVKEKALWEKAMGKTEAKKKAEFERKNRVKMIVEERIPGIKIDDNDIIDSIGIGLWALHGNI